MIWNEDALRTTWESINRPQSPCCSNGAVGIQNMGMSQRFIQEAFGRTPPPARPFYYVLLTCLVCRRGLGMTIEEPCQIQDLPWGPPHIQIPNCTCKPPAPDRVLEMLKAH